MGRLKMVNISRLHAWFHIMERLSLTTRRVVQDADGDPIHERYSIPLWAKVIGPQNGIGYPTPMDELLHPEWRQILAWVRDAPYETQLALNLTAEIDPGACRRWAAELWEADRK